MKKRQKSILPFYIDTNHAKDIPEALQVSILMEGVKSELISLVMPKNPQTLEEMRQAKVLAEQTTSASKTKSVSALSHENSLHAEIQCQLSKFWQCKFQTTAI